MSTSRHLLLLSCVLTFALACANRPELARAKPAAAEPPRWDLDPALHVVAPGAATRPANPYAPTRSRDAGIYSWQSEKRADCRSDLAARADEIENDWEARAARGVLAALPERSSESDTKAQPVSADLVIAGLRPAIHQCFSRWLDARLDAQGSVRFALELGCAGDVEAISAENNGVDESTMMCLFSAVAPARFTPPAGGRATLLVPVVFKNAAR